MLFLTPQERRVILSLIVLILSGSIIKFFNLDSKILGIFSLSGVQTARASQKTKSAICRININVASLEELEKIPGIGKVMAQRIVEYREGSGLFKNIEDFKRVKGIGDKKAKSMEEYISFGF